MNTICRNCGDVTSFGANVDPDRVTLGWCAPCFDGFRHRPYRDGEWPKKLAQARRNQIERERHKEWLAQHGSTDKGVGYSGAAPREADAGQVP